MCGLFFLIPGLVLLADCTRQTIEERPSFSITGGMMEKSAYIQPSQSIRQQSTSVAEMISLLKMVKEAGRVRGVGPNVRKESLPSSPFNPFGASVVTTKRLEKKKSGPFVRDPNCNSSQLREILVQSITCSPFESKQRINAAIERNLDGSFSIICAECAFSYLAHTIQYCRHTIANVTCLVFRDDDPREIRNL